MDKEAQQLKDVLGSRGLKNTRERETILRELEVRKGHFNAEKLYSVLNRKGTKVSRPTIYRTLKLLEKYHLIDRLDIKQNCFYYEPVFRKKDHGHLICEKCGKIIDFSWGSIENLKSEVCKEKNFKPDGAPRAKPVVPPCSSAESAEAYPPTHKASEGYPLRIHPRP